MVSNLRKSTNAPNRSPYPTAPAAREDTLNTIIVGVWNNDNMELEKKLAHPSTPSPSSLPFLTS